MRTREVLPTCQVWPQVSRAAAIECSIEYRERIRAEEAALSHVDVGTVVLDLGASSGMFGTAGLDVTEHPLPSSPAQFRSLAVGDLQIALSSLDNVLAYRFNPGTPPPATSSTRGPPERSTGRSDRALGPGLYGRLGLPPRGSVAHRSVSTFPTPASRSPGIPSPTGSAATTRRLRTGRPRLHPAASPGVAC